MSRVKLRLHAMEARTGVVKTCSDEVWIGVKGQSNWDIAGSPRNIFRYSLNEFITVVKHSLNLGGASLPGFY